MSADFWSGYVSGAVGILIGNPLDVLKVRLQATANPAALAPSSYARQFHSTASLVTGTAAPILGYGALNALLFVSYNRTEAALNAAFTSKGNSLWSTWLAGAAGGLATWAVSTPTELIKCRAQTAAPPTSSWAIARQILRTEGVRGLYFGGAVTALRDSVGYGFYFWTYEVCNGWVDAYAQGEPTFSREASKVLLCGGLAGIATWGSIFPLDVVKTRVQTQPFAAQSPLLNSTPSGRAQPPPAEKRLGTMHIARLAYQEGGMSVFFRGLSICSIRAFIVNAAQWAVYEWMMHELGHGRKQRNQ